MLTFVLGAEVTMSCVLLILSGLVVKGALGTVPLVGAFPIDDVLTGRFVLESYDYETVEHRSSFYDALVRSLEEDPDVETFTLGSAMPGDGTSRTQVGLEGVSYEREQDWPLIQRRIVGPHFFDMFDMALLAGRVSGSGDRLEEPPVVMVNEAFARQQLPDGYVVGRRLMIGLAEGEPVAHEIVGLVTDPGISVDDGRRVAAVFLPLAQSVPEVSVLAVRARSGFEEAREIMVRDVRALDADLPLAPIVTLEAIVRRENDGGRIFGSLFGAFGLSALILAIVGLHGVVSFTTQQRTREIGVMRALGAQQRGVLVSTITRGLRPVVVGVVLETGLALLLAPLLGEGLFGTDPRDPWVLTLVPLTLLLGATGAALLPALRASMIDPVTALRAE